MSAKNDSLLQIEEIEFTLILSIWIEMYGIILAEYISDLSIAYWGTFRPHEYSYETTNCYSIFQGVMHGE